MLALKMQISPLELEFLFQRGVSDIKEHIHLYLLNTLAKVCVHVQELYERFQDLVN